MKDGTSLASHGTESSNIHTSSMNPGLIFNSEGPKTACSRATVKSAKKLDQIRHFRPLGRNFEAVTSSYKVLHEPSRS
jgi:hypothetical protein